MMQFTTNTTTLNQAVAINLDLDIMFNNGLNTCHMLEPISLRGVNKRCIEEIEKSTSTSNYTSNKRSRCAREVPSQVKGLVQCTLNNNNISQKQPHEVGISQTTNYTNIPPHNNNNNNNNNNNSDSSHLRFTLDTKMNGCIDEMIEYSHYLERNAYGYRDH